MHWSALGTLIVMAPGVMVLALMGWQVHDGLRVYRLTPSGRLLPARGFKPFIQPDSLVYSVFVIGVLGTVWSMLR